MIILKPLEFSVVNFLRILLLISSLVDIFPGRESDYPMTVTFMFCSLRLMLVKWQSTVDIT